MRTIALPFYLARSRLRTDLLFLFFLDLRNSYYLRELARRLKVSPGALARELKTLSKEGLLLREAGKGKEVFYRINLHYPLFNEIKGIVEKVTGRPKPMSQGYGLPKRRPDEAPVVYVVAGPNGAGKTTFARRFLPEYVQCKQFVNADLIAGGLSPFSPEELAIRAGKLLLEQIESLAGKEDDFGFETTLSGKIYQRLFPTLREQGSLLRLFFLWIPSVELALSRIRDRVQRGGHSIPEPVVERRFERGLQNFFKIYQSLVDSWALFDNSGSFPHLVAAQDSRGLKVMDNELFDEIKKQAGVGSL